MFTFVLFKAFATADSISVYFGAGCFWHMQHSFIVAEQDILHRDSASLTSLTGYAGSTSTDSGLVCYHNADSIGDYGQLGHAEAVHMVIPAEKFQDFSQVYADQFENGWRRDPQDRGGEYRSVVGIPGGIKNTKLVSILQPILEAAGLALVEGKGNEDDSLEAKVVYAMDSDKFPFYQAEMWHQFHDDMIEKYDSNYHAIKSDFKKDCRIHPTGCPDHETSKCKENHDPVFSTSNIDDINIIGTEQSVLGGTSDTGDTRPYVIGIVIGVIAISVGLMILLIHQKTSKRWEPLSDYTTFSERPQITMAEAL